MKRSIPLILICVLAVLVGQTARSQSPNGPTPPASPQDQQKDPQPTASPSPAQTDGATQSERPLKPPVLRGNNHNLVDQKTSSKDGPEEVGEGDVVRVETTLISIPVSVMDRDGKYIPDLHQDDFRVWEDGAEQQVAYFQSTEQPFTVVLMIDTSGSTRNKLQEIQNAAIAFVGQLRPADRVMLLSFNDKIKILTRPTNDQNLLRQAILRTERGTGTRLFDAVDQVINKELHGVEGRKAIVLFTDGVDTSSRTARYYYTMRDVEESGALVYPVKYDTYSDLKEIDREAPNRGLGTSRAEYERGDRYLNDLARVSGARVYDAGQHNLDYAFRRVAEELRRQYSVGYYPKKIPQPGDRRTIKVRVNRPELVVRTRDSYIFHPKTRVATSVDSNQARTPPAKNR